MCDAILARWWKEADVPLPSLSDPEGTAVPEGLTVIDAHVHLFPPRVFDALWRWFETNAWPIRYRLYAEDTIEFLLSRGVKRIVGLHYSHQPGMARVLNRFAADLAAAHSQVTALGTVLPGEPDAEAVVKEAFEDLGLHGLKLHCHVQQMAPDDPRMMPIYKLCEAYGKPMVLHAGREPALPSGYGVDPYEICSANGVRRVLEQHPELTLVVPHLGADEIEAYGALIDEFPGLWLDTTMLLADYFPQKPSREYLERWGHRILYGSDFPGLPYAWDRELKQLLKYGLPEEIVRGIASENAKKVFG
jgi:predicted TIM-barrel fold metal-dependent hydrolase